jgi:NAD(P)-dependent dehydrogenase (short-subunit alcohol dehydrogenase family)
MDLGLEGCVAIVGGSSSGMGRACALALAREGCNVTLFARREELLDEAAAEIGALGSGAQALAVTGDATDTEALRTVVERTLQRFGRLDVLVNNTGGPSAGTFEDFDDDDWREAWELTLMSTLRLTRFALPALRESGRGRIVNITSSAVKEPIQGLLLSNTYRPGVIGWAKTLSQDEAPTASRSTPSPPATSTRTGWGVFMRLPTTPIRPAATMRRPFRCAASAIPPRSALLSPSSARRRPPTSPASRCSSTAAWPRDS